MTLEGPRTAKPTIGRALRKSQLYAVKLDGSGLERLSREDGTHDATFAGDGKHYVDEFSARMTPPRVSVCAAGGACQKVWESRSPPAGWPSRHR